MSPLNPVVFTQGGVWRWAWRGDYTPTPTSPPDDDPRLSWAEREVLTLGAYIPGWKTTGLLSGWNLEDLTPITPNGSSYYITTNPGQVYENCIFWGEVRPNKVQGVTFKNCAFAGPSPAHGLTTYNSIRCYDQDTKQWWLEDCVIDPFLWSRGDLNPPGGAYELSDLPGLLRASIAIRGGRGTVRRVDIRNAQDGFHWIQSKANPSDPAFLTVEGSWIHAMNYYRGPLHPSQPEGTHSDGFQSHYGSNLILRGNMIGGAHSPFGYNQTPAYNSGDDCYNAGIMLKQETWNVSGVPDRANREIQNVLIEKNFFNGGRDGSFGINHFYNSNYPNEFTTTQIKDNFFIQRTDTDYVVRPTRFSSLYSNNKVITLNPGGETWNVVGDVNYKTG